MPVLARRVGPLQSTVTSSNGTKEGVELDRE